MNNCIKRKIVAPLMLIMALTANSFSAHITEKTGTLVEKNQPQSWYGGLGYTTAKATCIDGCEDITYGFLGRIGYDFSNYLGTEVRLLKTFLKYEQQKIEYAGLFLKPMYPISEKMSIYGLLGYGTISTGDKIVYDDSGLSWSIGLNYYLGENEAHNGLKDFTLFVDYERLLQKSDSPDFDSVTFGVMYNF